MLNDCKLEPVDIVIKPRYEVLGDVHVKFLVKTLGGHPLVYAKKTFERSPWPIRMIPEKLECAFSRTEFEPLSLETQLQMLRARVGDERFEEVGFDIEDEN